MLKTLLLTIGASLALAGCSRYQKAGGGLMPEIPGDPPPAFTVEDRAALVEMKVAHPEAFTKIQGHSNANAAKLDAAFDAAVTHNKRWMKEHGWTDADIEVLYGNKATQQTVRHYIKAGDMSGKQP